MRREHSGVVLIFMVGVGLVASAYAIWVQGAQISQNQRLIKQQQVAMDRLLDQAAEDRAQTAQLRSLVQALQQQVRDLGGTPLTQAPTPSRSPAAAGATPSAAPATARPRATRTRAPSPRPSPASPQPSVFPKPTPSPSPSGPVRICVGNVCVGG